MNDDQSPSNELGHQVFEALTIAADVVCDTKCPSVWKTGEKPPHSDECKKVRAARSAWMDFLSYSDLIASGGLAGAPLSSQTIPEAKSNLVTQSERDILNGAVIPPAPEADAWDKKRSAVSSQERNTP